MGLRRLRVPRGGELEVVAVGVGERAHQHPPATSGLVRFSDDLGPELARSGRIFPDTQARRIQDAYQYKRGLWNAWFVHENQTRITDTETNRQPYLVDFGEGAGKLGLQWVTVATKRLRVVGRGAPETLRVTWSGELALPAPVALQTPGRSTSWRVVVEEQELLDADAPGVPNDQGQTVTVARTVYADTIAL